MSKLQRQWDALRDDGEGYGLGEADEAADVAVGGEAEAIAAAIAAEGWELLVDAVDDDVAIARKSDGTLVGVGWVYGPWAIELVDD